MSINDKNYNPAHRNLALVSFRAVTHAIRGILDLCERFEEILCLWQQIRERFMLWESRRIWWMVLATPSHGTIGHKRGEIASHLD